MTPMQHLQHAGMWDTISIPYHSIHSPPNLVLVYFYSLYFLQPREDATALVELKKVHANSNICAIFHITSCNTFPVAKSYHFIFPSSLKLLKIIGSWDEVRYVLLSLLLTPNMF